MSNVETRLSIAAEADVATASLLAKSVAADVGFDTAGQAGIATVVSELARNILKYAVQGSITLRRLVQDSRCGVEVVASDDGPGIEDVAAALTDHFSTAGSLGLGLPGVRRLVDEFDLETSANGGTRVSVRKWARP